MAKIPGLSGVAAVLTVVGLLQSSPTNAQPRFYVNIGPPAVVVETRAGVPRAGHVWRPGYYRWTGNRYVWVRGGYVRPPFARARWSPDRWDYNRRGSYEVPGYWARRVCRGYLTLTVPR